MPEIKSQSFLKNLFKKYQYKSKVRSIKWELTIEDFKKIISNKCSYCGAEPKHRKWRRKSRNFENVYRDYLSIERFNGIDRIDNSKGYSLENSTACCQTCNAMKSSLSVDEFLTHVLSIYAHMESK